MTCLRSEWNSVPRTQVWWGAVSRNLDNSLQGVPKKMHHRFCLFSLATYILEGWNTFCLKGVQKHLCTISGSWDINKSKWGIRSKKSLNIGQSNVLKSDVSLCITYILAPLCLQKCVWARSMSNLRMSPLTPWRIGILKYLEMKIEEWPSNIH